MIGQNSALGRGALWVALAASPAAVAQEVIHVAPELPAVNAQLYRQPLDALTTMWTNDASMRPTKYFIMRAGIGYARDPFLYEWVDGYKESLLRDAVNLNLAGTIHFWRMRFGVDIPIYLLATSDQRDKGAAGLGAVLLDLKGTILDHDKSGVGLALAARTELPTNTTGLSLGRGLAYEAELIVDGKVGGFVVAANIGHRGVPKADLQGGTWDDGLILRAGVGYMFQDRGGLSFDVGSMSVYSGFFQKYTTPVEGMLGGWARINKNLVLRMGLGAGLTDAVGSPLVRTVTTLAWEPSLRVPPPPPEPEPIPEPEPEPVLPPGPGRLVLRTLDVDGNPVEATAVVTHISVPDLVDLPDRPTNMTLAQGAGASELPPGRIAIVVSAPGYADVDMEGAILPDQTTSFTVPMTSRAARKGTDRIEIKEQVFFDYNKATIKPESFPLLKEVAFLVRQYPQIRMVRIEGHTDSRGSDEYNFALSNDRAESVMEFLISQGVERSRLNSIGYGERRPLDPRENEEAWALNRRVDFFIEEWDPEFTPESQTAPVEQPAQQP
jgi:outer membrane protein OmpA-like peptidoglycan-associated protein